MFPIPLAFFRDSSEGAGVAVAVAVAAAVICGSYRVLTWDFRGMRERKREFWSV